MYAMPLGRRVPPWPSTAGCRPSKSAQDVPTQSYLATICGSDASETDALRNGRNELKRFFCLPCVREKQEQGEARAIIGATQFLNKNKQ